MGRRQKKQSDGGIVWGVGRLEKAARKLELPSAVLANVTHMEFSGNTQVTVEGCGGILEYTGEVIRVKTGKMVTKFSGRNLHIRCLREDSLIVEGFVTAVEFLI